jgi:hypothetical protein
MSKRILQVVGAMLLVATIGIVSCQSLFAAEPDRGAAHVMGGPAGR